MSTFSLDLLNLISAYLDIHSLFNLSLVNRQCNGAASKHIFRTVRIEFLSSDDLHNKIEQWSNFLASSKSFLNVYHVHVLPSACWAPHSSQHFLDCGDQPIQAWRYFFSDRDKIQLITDEAEWDPLLHFLGELPALKEFTWGCVEQIPLPVLRYIDKQTRPHVRLHLKRFMLGSLLQSPEVTIKLDPHDQELAKSQSLYSVTMMYNHLDEEGIANYNEQAIMDMVSGGAPNLRQISICYEASANSPWHLLAWQKPKRRWRREMLFPAMQIGAQGRLESLEIAAKDSARSLIRWGEVTDFSILRHLIIHSPVNDEALLWLTSSCRFILLHTLALNLESSDPNMFSGRFPRGIDSLIISLRPLKSLKLVGELNSETISLVLIHHGCRLRTLLLSSTNPLTNDGRPDFATVPFLHHLRRSCPVLEEISLSMFRSKGDASEVAIYQALGQITSLQKIHLSILCPQRFTWDRISYEEFIALCDQNQSLDKHKRRQLENALINLAMDENLARSIFYIISSEKPLYSRPLERLELRSDALQELGGYTTSDLVDILRYISRSWICDRSLRDDELRKCCCREYDIQEVLEREEAEQWDELPTIDNSPYAQAVCRVWPGSRENDWKKEWHSFALVPAVSPCT